MAIITVFYGEMGAGKSFSAKRHAAAFEAPFYEGDDAVTPEMQRYILKAPIPKRVLEDFLYNRFAPAVAAHAAGVTHLVVAQALYRREHRETIKRYLEKRGHHVQFYHVKVPVLRNLRQLWGRRFGFWWCLYWLQSHLFFQAGD